MSDFVKGLDAFKRTLDRISDNARQMHGSHQIPFSELFPEAFMCEHCKVASFEALIRVGGFEGMEFSAIPDADWDVVVREHTQFADWEAMRGAAVAEYAHKRVMRGV